MDINVKKKMRFQLPLERNMVYLKKWVFMKLTLTNLETKTFLIKNKNRSGVVKMF